MAGNPLQWHPAFYAAFQIELEESRKVLQFYHEYNLMRKPLQVDILVVKKDTEEKIDKNLGQIFRRHNIVEYKSPEDYLSVNDYYKVLGYASIYQANTEKVLEILPEEITITMVANHYPEQMIRYLKRLYHAEVGEAFPGIYYVTGVTFPMQVVVVGRLSKSENVWLSRLRPGLSMQEDFGVLAQEYKGRMDEPLYSTCMDVIIRANQAIYEEGKVMCDALRELFAKELEEREARGEARGEVLGEQKGKTKHLIQIICKKLNRQKTVAEIAEELEEDLQVVERICNVARDFAPEYSCDEIYNCLVEKEAEL